MRIVPERKSSGQNRRNYPYDAPMANRRTRIQVLVIMVLIMSLGLSVFAFTPGYVQAEEASGKAAKDSENSGGEEVTFHITLDPGHGGDDSGASGYGVDEKKLTLKLAKMIREELLQYDNVSVDLTRKKDKFVPLKKRTEKAMEQNADLMVSLHFDSYDPACDYSSGCSAIVSKKGSYRPAMNKEEKKIARSILQELSRIGVTNRGLIRRLSADGEKYPDGSTADYYAIIRNGTLHKIPSILVEHAFIDSEHDYYNFLETDKKLRKMARADARGIARYLRLKNKETGKVLKPLKDHGKTLVAYGKAGSYLKVRDKSYQLAQSRKSAGYDPSKNEAEEKAEESIAGSDGTGLEAGSEEAEDQAGSVEKKTDVSTTSTGAVPGARRKSMQLTAGLIVLLLAYYVWLILKEKQNKKGDSFERTH